ncbi:MAG: TlpA family protein disulfide reductase [Phenylobacterium sp.]|nr:TlpA family protein disulfide reductase [Phenylobacterium sp.]
MRVWLGGVVALGMMLATTPAAAGRADVGQPAHDYTVLTFDRQKVSSVELKGKVVVLNYWATWCTPCKAEMIVFDDYIRKHPDTDLKIYSITTEDSVPPSMLIKLASILRFPLARKLYGRGYGVMEGVPTTYVIDRSGVLRHAKAGAFNALNFEALVGPLLAQAAPANIPPL